MEKTVTKRSLEREVRAMDRGELTPGRVWKVTKLPDGSVKRRALDPETHRLAQAREWKANTEAAKIRREINITQDVFARTLLKIAAKYPAIVREAAMPRIPVGNPPDAGLLAEIHHRLPLDSNDAPGA